jgi:peptide/nickel transport system ATP-binding protein
MSYYHNITISRGQIFVLSFHKLIRKDILTDYESMTSTSQSSETRQSTGENILEIRDASVTFEMNRGTSRVLDSVSINIERDEILGIVGESGSGKSMFASALLDAVVDPGRLDGEITYHPTDGEPVDLLDLDEDELRSLRWEEISMVFQGAMSSWNPTMDIRSHFRETLEVHNYDTTEGMERARQLLSDLYLDPERVLDSYPHELSGGMQQRALIALSMILEPEVLVMDEPTAALDLLMQRSILQMLRDLQAKYDITLVFITHDLPLVAELADRLAVLYAFEFVEVGDTEDILENAAHPYTRALLNATPNLDADVRTMRSIEGSSPDPVDTPAGCSYHPRCPLATAKCHEEDPSYHHVASGHEAACFHWEQAEEEVPFNRNAKAEFNDTVDYTTEGVDETLLELNDLEVHFEDSGGLLDLFRESEVVRAVDGISIDIPENQVLGLIGESGCGKTTLGKAAIGLQHPTDGHIEYRGQDIWDARKERGDIDISWEEIRKSLQIIHQDPGSSLNPNKKVLHTLSIPLQKWQGDLSREDRRARILAMLETVGMTPAQDYAQRYPHQLSGGEKQRVALIRALLMNADLILADEAISALDVSLRVEMMDLFLNLQDQFDTSFLFISHDLSNARYLTEKADGRIGIMYLGELVEVGPATEVINNPKHPYTQALRWATPDLFPDEDDPDSMPLRKIDIPDPKDPPSGCRFHTRCPKAREVCTRETPEKIDTSPEHGVACFREYPSDHEYWDSNPLSNEQETDERTVPSEADDD